jgi:uncharacterized protein DUF2771
VRRFLGVVILAVALAGCSSDPPAPPPAPKIDFTVGAKKVSARPYLYCNIDLEDCKQDNAAMVKIVAAPGVSVHVTVPKEIADTPWSVVIQYKNAAGEQVAPETAATFGPGKASTFEAKPPTPTDQLQTVEVKQAGGKLGRDDKGEPIPLVRGVWSAQVSPS